MKTFASRLRKEMAQKDMTQTDLCKLTGISKSSMSQYLSGKNVPSLTRMNVLADAIGIPLDKLMGYNDSPSNKSLDSLKITVRDAARCMGKSDQFVRVGLRRGLLPFGVAVQGTGTRWNYYIRPEMFRKFVGESVFNNYLQNREA